MERLVFKTREEWLEGRMNDLTASCIGALWNIHPYTTLYELFHEKKRALPKREASASMMGGLYFESGIVAYLKDQNPTWKFEHSSKDFIYYRDPESRLGATPDVLVQHPERGQGVIQIKIASSFSYKKTWLKENAIEVPDFIKLQTLVEAYLTESKWAAVAVATTDPFNVELIEVQFYDGLLGAIQEKTKEFWNNFDNNIEPKPNFNRDGDVIKTLHSNIETGKIIDLTTNNHILELCANRTKQQKIKKDADDRIKAIDAEVTLLLGDAESAELRDGQRISWVTRNRKSYTVEGGVTRSLKYPKLEDHGESIDA